MDFNNQLVVNGNISGFDYQTFDAKEDDPNELYKTAVQYHYGREGVEKNLEKAIEGYYSAAKQNHADSLLELGLIHLRGEGTIAKDVDKACEFFTSSSEQGNKIAYYCLGMMYSTGEFKGMAEEVPIEHLERAVSFFSLSAEKGYVLAKEKLKTIQLDLALKYLKGKGTEKDVKKAIGIFKELEKAGCLQSKLELGIIYFNEGNFSEAYSLLSQRKGNLHAQYILGMFYEAGLGNIWKNEKMALKFYRMSAAQGHALAENKVIERNFQSYDTATQFKLAKDYYKGEEPNGVTNLSKAASFFTYLSSHAEAQFYLGKMYYYGRGIDRDYNTSLDIFLKSTMLGCDKASFYIAKLYFKGRCKQINFKEGLQIAIEGANRGDERFQYLLGKMYYLGYGFCDEYFGKYITSLEEVAASGDVVALFLLGQIFRSEANPCQDIQKGMQFLQLSAEKGYFPALHTLASFFYIKASEINPALDFDLKRADFFKCSAHYYEILANAGNKKAKLALAKLYQAGEGVEKNLAKAYQLFDSLVKENHFKTIEYLLDFFPFKKGFEWCQMNASEGNVKFQLLLAQIYRFGLGPIQKNRKAAIAIYIALVKNKANKEAKRILEEMNANGEDENHLIQEFLSELKDLFAPVDRASVYEALSYLNIPYVRRHPERRLGNNSYSSSNEDNVQSQINDDSTSNEDNVQSQINDENSSSNEDNVQSQINDEDSTSNDDDMTANMNENSSEFLAQRSHSQNIPVIHKKYFFPEGFPELPITAQVTDKTEAIDQYKKVELQNLNSFKRSDKAYYVHFIESAMLVAEYYSIEKELSLNSDARYVFIRAGRKENALIPHETEGGRVILVASPDEDLKHYVDEQRDVLVIKEIPYYDLNENIKSPTVRKLAALLFAWEYDFSNIMILDDNIEAFYSTDVLACKGEGWKGIYNLYKNSAEKSGMTCLGVQTYHPIDQPKLQEKITINEGTLGYKSFYVDLKKIKSHLSYPHYLLPQDFLLWGEDMFFQYALMHANLKIGSFSKDSLVIARSKSNRNTCIGTVKNPQNWLEHAIEGKPEFYAQAVLSMRYVYKTSAKKYETKFRKLSNLNLSKETRRIYKRCRKDRDRLPNHFEKEALSESQAVQRPPKKRAKKVNGLGFQEIELTTPLNKAFYDEYAQILDGSEKKILRSPQKEAIFCLHEFIQSQQTTGYFEIATGVGKTYLYGYLTNLILKCENFNKNVMIVTPGIQAANQVYKSFVDLSQKMNVSSKKAVLINSTCIHQKLLSYNKILDSDKNVFIFTEESVKLFLKESDRLNYFGLVILDEFHGIAKELLLHTTNYAKKNAALVLGFSATPGHHAPLHFERRIFQYDLLQGYKDEFLTPWVVDQISLPFLNKKKVDLCHYEGFLQQLPEILKNHIHPHGKSLSENQGIIRVGKGYQKKATVIALEVANLLKQKGIKADYLCSILSEETKQRVLSEFDKKNIKVLVVVDMLGEAFDGFVDYVFFAQSISSTRKFFQNLGRAVRPELAKKKIAYIIVPKETDLPNNAYLSEKEIVWRQLDSKYNQNESKFNFGDPNTVSIVSQVAHQKHEIYKKTYPSKNYIRIPLKRGTSLDLVAKLSNFISNPSNTEEVRKYLGDYLNFILKSKNKEKMRQVFLEMKNKGDKNIHKMISQLDSNKGFIDICRYNASQQCFEYSESFGVGNTHSGIVYKKDEEEYEILLSLFNIKYLLV